MQIETAPLLLTLNLNPQAQLFFNNLRNRHFPAERNFIDAHLMLFHKLPPGEDSIYSDIENITQVVSSFDLQVAGISGIGNGVAYKVVSHNLQQLHKQLQHKWEKWLIPQDKNKLWPHITIQNKVSAENATELLQHLSNTFKPFNITATGLSLWAYIGGPWQFIRSFDFIDKA